ncbi:two-component system, OmpR family, phosphate regulon sensor histidine kinase PhoR [Maridesulfovibrio ferrireducens]|uniref:histidine kinase n=1 Tax=Maridesulfovibrio ferrireducens TaxID=246191 RepID=A0A1G9BTQ7_9BACT|nr:ATP-binding protein [Maridesulfovibrio ferrireducens]SDK42841.1 two-component system, OmpR family, phosphate regulon sensor histidine kinase PhoR [Maridesulfovibrio ferrireducens]
MPKKSLHMKILLWGWAVMLCALLLTFWFYYGTVAEELANSSGQNTSRLLNFVRRQISKSETSPGTSSFQKEVTELGHDLGIRITYIKDGKVLADSEVQEKRLSKLDDHSDRPEVIAAEASGSGENIRYSTTLDTRMLYVAKTMSKEGEFLRLALPYSVIGERLDRVKWNFALVLLLIAIGSALLLIYIGRRTSAAVTEISATARAIGEGDYSKRIRIIPGGEYQLLADSINTMARKIQGHIEIIEDQKNKLDAMFDNMKEGIMVLDTDGKIESVNRSMVEIVPETKNSKGRMPLEVLTRHEIQDSVDVIINNLNNVKSDSIILDFPDGRSMNVTICSFNDSNSRRKLILVFHDISEVRRIEMVLRDFVSNASHQLRTPLTSIKGYTETIIDNPPQDNHTLSKFLNIILDNANHMSKVITGMFALARSEYSGKKLRSEPTSLNETITHSINNLTKQAASKKIKITTGHIAENPVVGTDEGLIQIFENLLENAIKYAPENSSIKIETELKGDSITTKVIDEGPGITPSDTERIFERFFKLDENAVENGSSGLGLAICRSLVRNFNGDIWVESPADTATGTGSSFCVKLPVANG